MVRRKRIGLYFYNDPNWIGGTYYIANLIAALKLSRLTVSPEILAFTDTEDNFQVLHDISYRRLRPIRIGTPDQYPHWPIWLRRWLGKDKYCDVIYPAKENTWADPGAKGILWIPDFQPKMLPEFYDSALRQEVVSKVDAMVGSNLPLILSSQSSLADFRYLYPNAKNRVFVLNFAVTHPEFRSIDWKVLTQKYQLQEEYYYIPNQFWIHKNHRLVLAALLKLKGINNAVNLVFSGNETDFRAQGFADELKGFCGTHGLTERVRFLGFIDRKDQLKIMERAKAVIQPSLFEGWSTSIEDAKAMRQTVIASDLPVHIEQLGSQGLFFERHSADGLATLMNDSWNKELKKPDFDYISSIRLFGEGFCKICDQVI